jgi:hypothetical protein
VIHPAPGSDGRPSFTALVGNVDSDTAKYIATSRVQASRVEIIEDLQDMAKVSGFSVYIAGTNCALLARPEYVHEVSPVRGEEDGESCPCASHLLQRFVAEAIYTFSIC